MRWDVYKFTRGTKENTAEHLGVVEGAHQPTAHKEAAKRWPDLARAEWPTYQVGRLILRPEGDTRGLASRIIRKEAS